MKKVAVLIGGVTVALVLAAVLLVQYGQVSVAQGAGFKLGNEVLMSEYRYLVDGKRVGLVTNQSGVTSDGRSMINVLADDPAVRLVALYGPEHGIDGLAKAGEYVESYVHPRLNIPVYSLYGRTRMPTEDMLRNVDVLLFDIQDIGARTYTYMSTLNYCLVAAKKYNKPVVVLDRPNPLGGIIVDGPVLEDPYTSFVGVDNLPKAHGMTAAELALFYNRKIGANLKIVPMKGYHRNMIYQDTGLSWVQTSPNIPDLDSVFGYMATGLGEGTGIFQADKFKWIGGRGIDSHKFAALLNGAGLKGVSFIPETRGEAGGVRLKINDYRSFNPARTGIYALAYARSLNKFTVPKSTGQNIVMFDKIMGTDKMGRYLEQGLTPQQIEANNSPALNRFKEVRKKYLIYGYQAGYWPGYNKHIPVVVRGASVEFDSPPFIDANNRLMVPLRAIVEALGAEVRWNGGTREVTVTRAGSRVVFTIDSPIVVVNGKPVTMDTRPVIRNDRTMVPVRFISETIGSPVHWDQVSRVVTVH